MDINQIEYLCFEGGGIKALAFFGAIKFLQEKKALNNIKGVVGSSAGCILALGMACKADYTTMKSFIKGDLSQLSDYANYIMDVYRMFHSYGLCRGESLYKWYNEMLLKLAGNEKITFQELFNKTNIELVITGTNLNKMNTEYFSYKTTPNMEVGLAMRISTSIPLYFKSVQMNGDVYVDGGFLNNYPIYYFEPDKITKTLGLKLMSSYEKEDNNTIEVVHQPINNIKDYAEILIDSALLQIERGYIKKDYWNASIVIDTGKINSTDFNINKDQRKWLMKQGYKSCTNFFKK